MEPVDRRRRRRAFAVVLAALVPLGFASKLAAGGLPVWVGAHAGGALYVAFWIVLVLAWRPEWPAGRVAAAVLVATCALEVSQLWHPAFLEPVRRTLLGHALLGSRFHVADLPWYAAGAALGLGCAAAVERLSGASGARPRAGS